MDKRAMLLSHLAQAERHVAEGWELIAKQHRLIADLEQLEQNTSAFRGTLNKFLETQQLHEQHCDRKKFETHGLKPTIA